VCANSSKTFLGRFLKSAGSLPWCFDWNGGAMPMLINYADKIAQIKIVYYGPAAAGKTTSLQYLASSLKVEVVDMDFRSSGDNDRTVFFEYAPLTQKFGNWSVKFNFFTLPGQLRFSKTRALVLRGAQGIVYVADSQYSAAEENLRMLADLQDKLSEDDLVLEGLSAKTEGVVPIVLFYNKRDLQEIMPVEYMDATFGLRTWKVPKLSGSALTGENVLKAADLITTNLMRQLSGTLGLEEKDLA
jgi:mutual gliding-motility protein MglA